MHFIFMYAFYICLAAYLVFTYYERIKCIYIFSIYINMRAAVGPTHYRSGSGQSTRATVCAHTRPAKRAVPARARNLPCRAVFGPG
jgi:type IV secretory pathway VirB6-like protein